MSATNQLIQTIYEFRNLLKYLGENHPNILDEWKSKIAGVDETPATDETTDADIPGVNQDDYRDRINS